MCAQIAPHVWRAASLPDKKKLLENDCVVVSALGDCNSGGDFDCDLNMVSLYDPWVKLVEMTAEAVDKAEMPDHEKAKQSRVLKIAWLEQLATEEADQPRPENASFELRNAQARQENPF